jgi:hypothetical protein
MESSPVNLNDIQTYVTRQRLLPLWIIQGGFMLGQIFFGMAVYLVYRDHALNPPLPESGTRDVMFVLTWVTVGLTAVNSFLVFLTYRFPKSLQWISIRKRNLTGAPSTGDIDDSNPAAQLFRNLIGRIILRLAMLEMPAVFGLAVCLLGVQTGVLNEQPDFWFNTLPTLFLFYYILATVPIRDRVLAQLEHINEIHEQGLNKQ